MTSEEIDVGLQPCAGCAFASVCKSLRLACQNFALYVDGAPERYAEHLGYPSRQIYDSIFDESVDELAAGDLLRRARRLREYAQDAKRNWGNLTT